MNDQFYHRDKKKSKARKLFKRLLKNKRALLGLAIAVPLLLVVLFGDRGILQRVKLEKQKAELQAKIRQAEEQTRQLQAESKALDGDHETIEKVAREKYGMVREGERVYKVNKGK